MLQRLVKAHPFFTFCSCNWDLRGSIILWCPIPYKIKSHLQSMMPFLFPFSTCHLNLFGNKWPLTGPWRQKLISQSAAPRGQLWPLHQATLQNKTCNVLQPRKGLAKTLQKHGDCLKVFHQATLWYIKNGHRAYQQASCSCAGNPDPLVFHAPQIMFDCLQQRISAGSRKKRLPNYTTGFVRRDALPLGIFTKYTWHIVNILHVKQIFDTPEVSISFSFSFFGWMVLFWSILN